MRFKDLSEKDKEYIKKTYNDKSNTSWEKRAAKLGDKYGVSERTIRKWVSSELGLKEKVDIEPEQYVKAKSKKIDTNKKIFLITSAQSNTPVNKLLLKNMEAYAKHIGGELLVIPFRYKNPTTTTEDNSDEYWDKEVIPYLNAKRHNLNNNITILADIKVQPTATSPLTSLESLTVNHSSVVGHPRQHLKVLPVLDSDKPKIICSTGCCTISNFSDSKIGRIGSFHHMLGFAIVEIKDKDKFFIRQVSADKNGDFIDLYFTVNGGSVSRVKNSLALVKGDIHFGNHDEKVLKRSFDELIPKIKPSKIILHDIFDGYSINPHEEKNFVRQYENEISGKNSLKKEIDNLINWLDSIKHLNLVVVFSNHDDFLTRFVINGDPKKNIKNALEYMEYGKVLLEGKAPNGIIPYIINQKIKNIKCLGRNESYKIKDWELGIHGMDGVNGSRGSIQQYRRLNSKVITAHAHTAVRMDGALQVGTNTKLRMGYNNGISNWINSDVVISANGKAQHIIYIGPDREFTTFK